MNNKDFYMRFWGVRADFPAIGIENMRYGGHTSCIELRLGKNVLIFNAGTGLQALGETLNNARIFDFDLFFANIRTGNITGLPFFSPLQKEEVTLRLWAGHLLPDNTLKRLMGLISTPLLSTLSTEDYKARVFYNDFKCEKVFEPKYGIEVEALVTGDSVSYRVTYAEKKLALLFGMNATLLKDPKVLEFIRFSDIVISDGLNATPENKIWPEIIDLIEEARADKLIFSNHSSVHDDDFMDTVSAQIARRKPGTIIARDDMTLTVQG
ncbi:MAG: hypothetical protein ACTSXQ_03735 [Alphaproteobacteria bacterium]